MGHLSVLHVKAAKAPGRYQDGDGLMLVVNLPDRDHGLYACRPTKSARIYGCNGLEDAFDIGRRRKPSDKPGKTLPACPIGF